jgi:hypothetical protein
MLPIIVNQKFSIERKYIKYLSFLFIIVGTVIIKKILYGYSLTHINLNLIMGVVIMVLIPHIADNSKENKSLVYAIILAAALNCALMILEFNQLPIMLSIKNYLFSMSQMGKNDLHEYSQYVFRYSGVYTSIFGFSYVLAVAAPAIFKRTINKDGKHYINLSLLILIFIGLIILAARSALLATVISIGAIVITNKRHPFRPRNVSFIIMLMICIAGVFYYLAATPNVGFIGQILSGDDVRGKVWGELLKISIDNLMWGITIPYENAVTQTKYILAFPGDTIISPHNSIINISIRHGVFGLIAYIYIIVYNAYEYIKIKKKYHTDNEIIIYYIMIFSYLLNSMFHNASIITSIDLWILFGMKYSYIKNNRYIIH